MFRISYTLQVHIFPVVIFSVFVQNWDMTAYTSGTQGAAIAWFVSLDCHSAHPGVFGSSAMGLAVYGSYATGHVSPPVSQDNHPYVQFGRHRREPTWSSSFRE